MKVVVLSIAIAAATQLSDDTARVLARLDAYLASYEPRLSELVADERMEQVVRYVSGGHPGRNLEQRRLLSSEVAFVALDNAGWLGIRHVKKVDDKPVALGAQSLEASLRLPKQDAARALLRASAAHNLGPARTTNLPNLPLELLHARNRHRFRPHSEGREMVGAVETTCIVLAEQDSPTLIGHPKTGGDMPSEVRAWVDDAGRLLRAQVTIYPGTRGGSHDQLLRVEFADAPALGLLVPTEMYEEFRLPWPRSGSAVAHYSNFRRFQTAARIVPKP